MSTNTDSFNPTELKIALIHSTNNSEKLDLFSRILNENILQSAKICQHFTCQTKIINHTDLHEQFNYIFFITEFDKLTSVELRADINKISSELSTTRNKLFVVVDECQSMKIDDDDSLIFETDEYNEKFDDFLKSLTATDNNVNICRIQMDIAVVWETILSESSIATLTENQIDLLSAKFVKKSSKMNFADKKRELKLVLKKINIDDELRICGYTDTSDKILKFFKLVEQKKIVCQNYLYSFNFIDFNVSDTCINKIKEYFLEIDTIQFLKSNMLNDLVCEIRDLWYLRLEEFMTKTRPNVSFGGIGMINTNKYILFLTEIKSIAQARAYTKIVDFVKKDIDHFNGLIITFHKREIEKTTDFEKIGSGLEAFASGGQENVSALFTKLLTNTKIISDNIRLEKSAKSSQFVDQCLRIGIEKELLIRFLEEMIMAKISHYTDATKIPKDDISIIYPHSLQIFLLSNINTHFVFKKLYMYLMYTIRYSGRNIGDTIKNLTQDQYDGLLVLENKLRELCVN